MSLPDVIESLRKQYNVNIVHITEDEATKDIDVIPTGLAPFDIATGIGGIARGFFTEVFSPEGVGKTTFALHLIAKAQGLGLGTAYVDMEHRLDPSWAEKIGVDLSQMLLVQPSYGEAALNVVKALASTGEIGLIAIDSIPALVPKKELEGEGGDQFVGLQARLIAQFFRQATGIVKENNVAVLLINQFRSRIGGIGSLAYGPQKTTPGGYALKHYASMRLDMRRIKTLKDVNGDPSGQIVGVKIVKSSLSTPYRGADIVLTNSIGFDPVASLIDLAIKEGFIEQSGSWYTYNGQKAQGQKGISELISADNSMQELYDKIMKIYLPWRYE